MCQSGPGRINAREGARSTYSFNKCARKREKLPRLAKERTAYFLLGGAGAGWEESGPHLGRHIRI